MGWMGWIAGGRLISVLSVLLARPILSFIIQFMLKIDEAPVLTELDLGLLEGYGGFPESLHLISVGEDKYAANNVSLEDGQKLNGLAAFPSPDDATTYMGLLAGLNGEIVKKSFEEARQIAISKPVLNCVLLFVDGRIVDMVYVR